MKHTITTRLAVLLLFAAGMAGCSEEDTLPGGTTTTPDSARCPMTISVADGRYTANDPSAPGTRAVEDGYTTRFTAGDKIGLYAVKNGTIVASNVCLTATESSSNGAGGNSLVWTGDAYYEGTGTTYFAYYPYQSPLSGTPDASATNASGFFANVVSVWTPSTDQSTYAKYTAQDLMTGSGTAEKQDDGTYSLSFTLAHAMALVVIEIPTTRYALSTDNSYTWTTASPATFYGFTPYNPSIGTYRLLVKPTQSGAGDLIGSYTAEYGNTKEYAVSQNGITAANYALYTVDGGAATTVAEKTHTLQMGDFYLSDGSLVSKDVENLSDAQKAACLGIVMKVGKDDSGDWKDTDTYKDKSGNAMSTIRGYVLALKDGNGGNICTWGPTDTEVGTNTEKQILFCGYSNTQKIKNYAKESKLKNDFPAAYHASDGYEATYASPGNSSGWFFPSAGQCKYWYENREVLKQSMDKAGGDGWHSSYWSSSEHSGHSTYGALVVDFSNGNVNGGLKSYDYNSRVRSCLAF